MEQTCPTPLLEAMPWCSFPVCLCTQQLLLLLYECSVNSLSHSVPLWIVCSVCVLLWSAGDSVWSFSLPLSTSPSYKWKHLSLSLSLSLTHTHTQRHRHTQTDEDSVTCIWFVLKFQVGFFTGSSSDDTTIYWFQAEICVHRWWVHRSGVHYKCKENRMCNDVKESLCDDMNTKFECNLMDIELHVCNRTFRVLQSVDHNSPFKSPCFFCNVQIDDSWFTFSLIA